MKDFNLEAERAIIGSILMDEDNYWSFHDKIDSDYFYLKIHKEIYKAIQDLVADKIRPTRGAIIGRLGEQLSDEQSTTLYLMGLLDDTVKEDLKGQDFIDPFLSCWLRRALQSYAQDIQMIVKKPEEPVYQLPQLKERIISLSLKADPPEDEDPSVTVSRVVDQTLRSDRQLGISTGIDELDDAIGAIMPEDFVGILASQGDGKTTVALQVARYHATLGGSMFFELEMTKDDLWRMNIGAMADISTFRIFAGVIDDTERDRVRQARRRLMDLKLFIDDTASMSIERIYEMVMIKKKRYDIKSVFIDHAMKLRTRPSFRDDFSKASYITNFCKTAAKELHVPFILLAQRSRLAKRRSDSPEPHPDDFRGGPSLEEDADTLVGLFRRDVWLSRNQPLEEGTSQHEKWKAQMAATKGTIEYHTLKRRRGPSHGKSIGTFFGEKSRVGGMSK